MSNVTNDVSRIEIKRWWDGKVLATVDADTLTGADLTRADLTDADLTDADLTGANLTDADLTGADLTGADLTGADLTGANLTRANLTGADLTGADIDSIRNDVWAVLSASPAEARGVQLALEAGTVDGSTYGGPCACLVGTIAVLRHCRYDDIPDLEPDSTRPAEVWFMGIRKGDTPATNPMAAIAHGWIKEWCERIEGAFA